MHSKKKPCGVMSHMFEFLVEAVDAPEFKAISEYAVWDKILYWVFIVPIRDIFGMFTPHTYLW